MAPPEMKAIYEGFGGGAVAAKDSRGYSIFRELCESGPGPGLPNCRNMFGLPESAGTLPPAVLKTLHAKFLAAVDSMLKHYGTVSIEWSAINAIELADGRKFPCGAGGSSVQTVWQGSKERRAEDGTWRVGGGSDFMMATEMSDPPVVYSLRQDRGTAHMGLRAAPIGRPGMTVDVNVGGT
jgi:hypothetical protein